MTAILEKEAIVSELPMSNESTLHNLEQYQYHRPDPIAYFSIKTATDSIFRHTEFIKGQNSIVVPELAAIRTHEMLSKPSKAHILVVGGGMAAEAAVREALKNGVVVIHAFDKDGLGGQTTYISYDIHKETPSSSQKLVATTFSSPGVLSISERLTDEQLNELTKQLKIDYVLDARGVDPQDERKLEGICDQRTGVSYEIDYSSSANHTSREIISKIHKAMDDQALMIELITTQDFSNPVISGGGKVAIQDLVAKMRLLQIAQKAYREKGIVLDLQKLSSSKDRPDFKEYNSVLMHAKEIGINIDDLGPITVVGRSLPRLINPTLEEHKAAIVHWDEEKYDKPNKRLYHNIASYLKIEEDASKELVNNYLQHIGEKLPGMKHDVKEMINDALTEIVRDTNPGFEARTQEALQKWTKGYGFTYVQGTLPRKIDSQTREITYTNYPVGVNLPTHASIFISALGTTQHPFPEDVFNAPGNVTGMRAGGGNISSSAAQSRALINEYLADHAEQGKTPEENLQLYNAYQAYSADFAKISPVEAMLSYSPKILTRDWIHDPMPLDNPTDLQISLQQKTAEITTFESKLLLKYVYEKLGHTPTGQEDLNLQISQDGKITIGADNQRINSFDELAAAVAGVVDKQYSHSNNPLEDALIARSANSLQNMHLDLSLRFTQTALRKLGYSDKQILSLEANLITQQFPLSSEGIVSETFDSDLSSWAKTQLGSPQTSSPEQQKLFTFTKSDIAAIMLSILTGTAASLLDMDHHLFYTIARNGIGFSTLILAINEILSKESDQTLNRGARFAILSFATSMISYLATSLILKD